MEVFEKVLFNALMDVMGQVWNDQIESGDVSLTSNNVVEKEAI